MKHEPVLASPSFTVLFHFCSYIHLISRAFNFHKGYFCHGKSFLSSHYYLLVSIFMVLTIGALCQPPHNTPPTHTHTAIPYQPATARPENRSSSMIILMFTEWITVPSYTNVIGNTIFIYSVLQYIYLFAELPVKFVWYRHWKRKSGM